MKTRIKDLFKGASQSTADFFTMGYSEGQEIPGGSRKPNVGDVEMDLPPVKQEKPKGIIGRIKDAFKDAGEDTYSNRVQTYNQYLKTLNSYKTDKVSLSGRVGLSLMSPKSAKSVGRVSMTNYEQKLAEWNRRMREFSIRRYYASLGKRK